jgi:RimJ/RimL family protein N-acetyltransferase
VEDDFEVHIREAIADDNAELQNLQAQCPMGTNLVVSSVNTPDFFARAKAFEFYRVYVACTDQRIIGSAALAIRKAVVNGAIARIGYEFQYFTSPDHRKEHVARQLHQHIEDYLNRQGVVLSYALIMEGNLPAIRLFESQSFKIHRTLVMPGLAVYRQMDVPSIGKIRPISPEDLEAVAELLNETWQGFELYEPTSADQLDQMITRTPGYSFDSFLVLEKQGKILACLGFWDWNKISQVTVKALNRKLRMIGMLLNITRLFRPMPRSLRPGQTLKQIMLTTIAFKDAMHLRPLLRFVNNQTLLKGSEHIFCVCEKNHMLLSSMKGFIRIDTAIHLYIKFLQPNALMKDKPVFINGIDL